MPSTGNDQQTADTIVELAEMIARSSPECAPLALQIVDLARGLGGGPDQGTIQDVLDADLLDDSLSDVDSQSTASAVAKALKV
jgi:hypothetical protein